MIVSGSNTFTVIGPTVLSGSVNITGSMSIIGSAGAVNASSVSIPPGTGRYYLDGDNGRGFMADIEGAGKAFNLYLNSVEKVKIDINTANFKDLNISSSGNLKIEGTQIDIGSRLPTSDPGVAGRLFTSGSTGAGIPKQVWVSGG